MGWNPIKEAEKAAKKAVNKIVNPAVDAGKRGVNQFADQAKSSIRKAGGEIEGGLKKVGHEAEDGIRSAGREVEEKANALQRELESLPDKIEEELQDAIEAFAKSITAEGLRRVRSSLDSAHKKMTELRESKPDLVDAIDEVSFYVEFGPVTATYASFYSRSEGLSHVLSQPPDFKRSSIVEFFRATVPTSIDFGLSVQVVALVVGSKELGIGGGMGDIPGALAVELLDVILEAAGVPE